jgi:hypothetical protein
MPALPTATKLRFNRDPQRPKAFADLYRFGSATDRAPLVVYVGGAIGRREYDARSRTAPDPIAREFARAVDAAHCERVDLLVCPCPVDTGGEGYDGFVAHFDDELVPATGTTPAVWGCVGYSAGAAFAAYLAVIGEARAAAVFGAAGLHDAFSQGRNVLDLAAREGHHPTLALFRNDADQTADSDAVPSWMRGLDVTAMGKRPGAHRFSDYASNGTVADAFRFVLERLRS